MGGKKHKTRKSKQKNERTTILVVCGGVESEVNYFESFPIKTVIVEVKGYGKDPYKLIKKAIQLQSQKESKGEHYNQIWCIFDKDGYTFTDENFNQAIRAAEKRRFGVAYSNQSFELWYCLHFHYIESALHRDQYCQILKKLFGEYKKNDPDMYSKIIKSQNEAIKNAKCLYAKMAHLSPAQQDPVTRVFELVEELNRFLE